MTDVDTALTLLQNKLRRQILERLVREPHYPMQLAEILGVSQQAIVKHLKELERGEFVMKMKVPSEKGGPPRTIYSVQQSMSLRIDLGPDLFHCEQRTLPAGGPMRLSNRLPQGVDVVVNTISGRKKISVGEGIAHIQQIGEVLENLDRQRDALIALHQHIRNRVSAGVDSDFDDYEQRSMVHNLIEAPQTRIDLAALSQEFQLGKTQMSSLLEEVQMRLERQLSERAGHIVAAPTNTNLRYWIGAFGTKSSKR
ncbi:MAG: helix-turn-helix domain-containing protein [Candidatus Poseidoniaceae archaeon]|jgi:ArsR family transcriptional regulator|tara:strand:- start:134 stop:895 length:762 start_codon:yes stop_codon:yes gene_type:complete